MVIENAPQYIIDLQNFIVKEIKDLRLEINGIKLEISSLRSEMNSLRSDMDKGFDILRLEMNERFDGVHREIEGLAMMTKNEIGRIDKSINKMSDDISNLHYDMEELGINMEKIEAHIGRYEIRAQNIELILVEDHKPRIKSLEDLVLK